ncbi:PREDICTED: LEAF RUST 10 DISEASE-RESISTANCE LOCUS RECEPTOR-LIKE PROTEIN KINASE-like 1.4 isoform X5 [Prunus mume]|uniref:non-specific serine/threonine protein kinase n=1 Tax=Prunus mume TaxID=102107 RepID=A0ABM0NSQ3_PRUMU|nr:PREDICTED: LEAF RUST 10 DISEASE-RESISTANCE LOCUS RECEPTOR-LIKE PROTEIN KINASE-like 1.4 isoform X5 [Prunus mume]
MHPLFLLFFFYSFEVTKSFPSNANLSNCSRAFDCGPLRNLSYPFAGGSRPAYCGPPEFHINCVNDSPELTILSLSYRVLQLDPVRRNLKLARSDLWTSTCTDKVFNSTMKSEFFAYNDSDDVDVSIFYGCNSTITTPKLANWFHCNNNRDFNDSYYLIGPVPLDPIMSTFKCEIGITVPILKTTAAKLVANRSLFQEAINEGFTVNYTNPYDNQCAQCLGVNGLCGFDTGSSEPVCICGNRVCDPAGKKKEIAIGLAVGGAILFGIFIGFYIYSFIQRKKKKLAALAQSKEIPTPLTSKSVATPSTNLSQSQSIPSYPSFTSKSDYDKGSTYFGVQVFSYTELEEATENFNPAKELGDGGFGTVYYGKLQDGRVVAVKRLYENNFKRVEQFMNEVEILTRLEHRNLVKLYGCTSRRSRELLLVYEYIPNGTVADHLHGKRVESGFLSWPVRLSIAIETADALAFLHRNDVIHRDVKTNNILIDNDFCVKVADFGLSRLFPNDVTHVSTAPQGTPGYVDPEYYQCYQLTDKSDVYSFGVVLIELISSLQAVDTNRHRHDINLANMAINKIQNHLVNELVDPLLEFETNHVVRGMATAVAELAFRCLQQERDMRPTMDEVLDGLRAIQNEDLGSEDGQAVVLDIRADDVGLLRNMPPPLSPDSAGTDKLVSSSTPPSSF